MTQEEAAAGIDRLMAANRKLTDDIADARAAGWRGHPTVQRLKREKLSVSFEIARMVKQMQDAPGIAMTPACETAGMSCQEAYKHLWMLEEFEDADEVRGLGILSGSGAIKAAADIRRARKQRMAAVA